MFCEPVSVCSCDSHSQSKSGFNQADWAHVKHLKNVPPPRRSLNLCEADDCLRVHLKINYFRCSKYSLRVEQFISLWFQDRRRVLSAAHVCIYISQSKLLTLGKSEREREKHQHSDVSEVRAVYQLTFSAEKLNRRREISAHPTIL